MELIKIVPNELYSFDLNEEYISILNSAEENYIIQVLIQDNYGYGVLLPGKFETSAVKFILPEQISIFSTEETYICKAQCILENQILSLFYCDAVVEFKAPAEPLEEPEIDSPLDDFEGSNDTSDEFVDHKFKDSEEEELDFVLNSIAPVKETKPVKQNLEELSKNLDDEFIKQALWHQSSIRNKLPEPVLEKVESPEKVLLKNKVKNILLGMLK